MILRYISDQGETVDITNIAPPIPDILLTEADGLYGYDNVAIMTDLTGADGSAMNGTRVSPRSISLKLQLYRDVVETRKRILRIMTPKALGTLRLIRDAVTRDIRCVVQKMAANAQNASELYVYLLCPNPYWREETESKVEISAWIPMFEYPLSIEQGVGFEFGKRSDGDIVNAYNPGSATVGARFIFIATGTVVNPRITNGLDAFKYIKANTTLYQGDILTVQTGVGAKKATIYRNTSGVESNAFSLLDNANITFLQLTPGDNYMLYGADSGTDKLHVIIFYYPQYLEV